MRGKLKQPRKFAGAFDRELKAWGDILTFDHMSAPEKNELAMGITGDTNAFVVKDLFSGLTGIYPAPWKDGYTVEVALRHFIGRRRIGQVYCDNAFEFTSACETLGIVVEHSQPGVPQTNAIIERKNGDVLAMTRTALVAAGLPPPFWPYASRCTLFNDNVRWVDGDSAWNRTHTHACQATLIPFGAGVWFPPPRR